MEQSLEKAKTLAGGAAGLSAKLTALPESKKITAQAISQWKIVPSARVLAVEKVTGVSRHELRPDLYGAKQASTIA